MSRQILIGQLDAGGKPFQAAGHASSTADAT
jgi:hypothetical protein